MATRKVQGTVDTTVLLRLLLPDHPAPTQRAEQILSTGVYDVPDVVLIELAFVLERVYKLSRVAVVENLRAVMYERSLQCENHK